MTRILVRKLLRDARTALLVVALLLMAFEMLWCKITQRITGELVPVLLGDKDRSLNELQQKIFEGPGKIVRTLMGGERVSLGRAMDVLSIGYVHPLVQTLLCIWAIGRAAGAIAGEIDRGTMELLLAQPVPRARVIGAHFLIDLIVIPVLCLSMWAGTVAGVWLVGEIRVAPEQLKLRPLLLGELGPEQLRLEPLQCSPALLYVGALLFAVSGYSLWLSAGGRFRGRVLGVAVLLTLFQFLVNVVGQLWPVIEPLRPLTVFYYYQPQEVILRADWYADPLVWGRVGVLAGVGTVGYLLALWTFCRRDLPAPL
ncbi:MAG: ABC transporter permease subunit [Gemmataceae bacterium]|nr:ABC transporter permease subunit [Gemmataceae bacterium]